MKASGAAHFLALDGLRGVAAFAVVLYHLGEVFGPPIPVNAPLAVDFFFMLSGFVLAHAYGERLRAGPVLGATSPPAWCASIR